MICCASSQCLCFTFFIDPDFYLPILLPCIPYQVLCISERLYSFQYQKLHNAFPSLFRYQRLNNAVQTLDRGDKQLKATADSAPDTSSVVGQLEAVPPEAG